MRGKSYRYILESKEKVVNVTQKKQLVDNLYRCAMAI